jgi:hypothetical protein
MIRLAGKVAGTASEVSAAAAASRCEDVSVRGRPTDGSRATDNWRLTPDILGAAGLPKCRVLNTRRCGKFRGIAGQGVNSGERRGRPRIEDGRWPGGGGEPPKSGGGRQASGESQGSVRQQPGVSRREHQHQPVARQREHARNPRRQIHQQQQRGPEVNHREDSRGWRIAGRISV